jgi:hypothetical protein
MGERRRRVFPRIDDVSFMGTTSGFLVRGAEIKIGITRAEVGQSMMPAETASFPGYHPADFDSAQRSFRKSAVGCGILRHGIDRLQECLIWHRATWNRVKALLHDANF